MSKERLELGRNSVLRQRQKNSQSYFDLFGSVEFADDPVEDLENEVQIWRSVARDRENPRQERKKLEAALEWTRRQLDCFESGGDKLQENLLH